MPVIYAYLFSSVLDHLQSPEEVSQALQTELGGSRKHLVETATFETAKIKGKPR